MVVGEDEIGRYQLRFIRPMASMWKISQGCSYDDEEVFKKTERRSVEVSHEIPMEDFSRMLL